MFIKIVFVMCLLFVVNVQVSSGEIGRNILAESLVDDHKLQDAPTQMEEGDGGEEVLREGSIVENDNDNELVKLKEESAKLSLETAEVKKSILATLKNQPLENMTEHDVRDLFMGVLLLVLFVPIWFYIFHRVCLINKVKIVEEIDSKGDVHKTKEVFFYDGNLTEGDKRRLSNARVWMTILLVLVVVVSLATAL